MTALTLADVAVQGICAQVDPDLFFPTKGGTSREALQVCAGCPVRLDCLEIAMHDGVSGIWGGTTHNQRVQMGGRRDLHSELLLEEHGTEAGAKRHSRAGEPACARCAEAAARAGRERKQRSAA